jgi:hypothetical protein
MSLEQVEEAAKKATQFNKVKDNLSVMRHANEEILRKRQLVHELQKKYPEIRLSSEAISRCQTD